jgi:hypothetical protein
MCPDRTNNHVERTANQRRFAGQTTVFWPNFSFNADWRDKAAPAG